MKKSSRLRFLDWDIETITLGDYSIEHTITKDSYDWFLENIYNPQDKPNGDSPGESLKKYMQREIEALLDDLLREKRANGEADGIKISNVKIADIVFAYNNAKLINLLRKRGGYINSQKYDEMREVEKEITQLKDDDYDTLTRPVCAFITFEEEDGYILA